MRALVLSARFPWPAYTGDRLRAAIWLSALQAEDVTLVAPAGHVPDDAPLFRFCPARRSLGSALAGAGRLLRGAPLQTLLASPYDWSEAIERARHEVGHFDVAIVLLSRLDAAVRAHLREPYRVLDAVDSLRRSMGERARQSSAFTRWLWRLEERRVARLEADAVDAYDQVVVVSGEDAGELDAIVVSNGVSIAPLAHTPRPFDFAFWGRLGYFANADAARWLLDEIWPAIRAARPDATLLLGGAGAPAAIRAADGRDGIRVVSPIADVAALARSVKVAIFPIRFGTGQSNKVLEAAEAGCAIAATPKAMRGLDPLMRFAHVAGDAEGLARAAVAALSDDASGAALRNLVASHFDRSDTLDRLAAIVRRREAAA